MKITFDELLEYALNKAISKEWRDFYLNGPDQVDYNYVKQFMTPDEFLFYIRKTHLYESDNYWHPNEVETLKATKQDGSWLVQKAYRTKAQVKLYSLLPSSFNKLELEAIALRNNISLDDTHYVRNSKLFSHSGTWPHDITYHLTPFKPITLPPPMHREVRYLFDVNYGLYKDHGRIKEDYIYEDFLAAKSKHNLDKYDLLTLFKRYLRAKKHYFRHEKGIFYFYKEII